ncbi:putative lipid-transfer protein DIR1 [Sesamum indicum]|uniref:Lipid-transfer protein DIR1 n=1 Tax=Sesamum indicum TaxID=4182 RepID=A0A8M8V3T0_SESIN|nr:putative lipid-transfer protein DIR1 [Sesamum indicum]
MSQASQRCQEFLYKHHNNPSTNENIKSVEAEKRKNADTFVSEGEDLMACKPAVVPPRPPPPSGRCCSALARADIRCLCTYKNSKLLPSLGIDPNLAVQLPDKCKLPHPAHC